MYALKESEIKPSFKAQGIQEAGKELDILKLSKEERRRYDRHLGNTRDIRSQFETYYVDGKVQGKAEGKAEGLAEGKAEERRVLITSMHRSGLPQAQV
ncbi:MAG: hypothetical protein ACH346_05310 [Chthoniobacterales bacterium]